MHIWNLHGSEHGRKSVGSVGARGINREQKTEKGRDKVLDLLSLALDVLGEGVSVFVGWRCGRAGLFLRTGCRHDMRQKFQE